MGQNLDAYDNFINRELSWLEFNHRVLEEAKEKHNPLLERAKFLSIVSSNLDEFFMIRVGALWDQVKAGFKGKDPAGLSPMDQIKRISARTHKLVYDQYNTFNRSVKQLLKKEDIVFLEYEDLDIEQREYVQDYYENTIFPILTPTVVDKGRPFPLIQNKSLNIALFLKGNKHKKIFATVQVPSLLDRLVRVPSQGSGVEFIFLEDIIKANLASLFNGHKIITYGCFRITRNADLAYDDDGAEDLLEAIEKLLPKRKWGRVVRMEYEKGMSEELVAILGKAHKVDKDDYYQIKGAIDLTFLMKLANIENYDHLKYEAYEPKMPEEFKDNQDIFHVISKKDVILYHPYQSFEPIVEFVRRAAEDPSVLAIKQTLYRVSGNSPIIKALARAAENGKHVTVLVELKARFDEENNINWARTLERAGCQVIYGFSDLKTHCKVLLVVAMENDKIKRYLHLGTGNYNDVTAQLYTDMGYMTTDKHLTKDASILFNFLSGYSSPEGMKKIIISPQHLRKNLYKLIDGEIENAKNGKKAKIIAKMNSLVDKEMIKYLYKASQAGVEIDLIVRGICCLRPGIAGISENITVRSIVGRFLEHTRVYYFHSDGEEKLYLSSADLMTRNLDRRVETMFPIQDQESKEKIFKSLDIILEDTINARLLMEDGSYKFIDKRGKKRIDSQQERMK